MTNNELIEIGHLRDMIGKSFTVFSRDVSVEENGEFLTANDLVLEHQVGGKMIETLHCESLAAIPDRFAQREIDDLEERYLNQYRIDYISYMADLKADLQRDRYAEGK